MTSIYDQSPLLPELIHLIATLSPIAWTQIATAVPDFGRYSTTDDGHREFARLFLHLRSVCVETVNIIAVTCNGVVRSVYDWPSVVMIKAELEASILIDDIINVDGDHPLITTRYWTDPMSTTENISNMVWFDEHIHRDNGPAVMRPDGHREWHRHGVLHREDGPAIIYANGSMDWWENNSRVRTLRLA